MHNKSHGETRCRGKETPLVAHCCIINAHSFVHFPIVRSFRIDRSWTLFGILVINMRQHAQKRGTKMRELGHESVQIDRQILAARLSIS